MAAKAQAKAAKPAVNAFANAPKAQNASAKSKASLKDYVAVEGIGEYNAIAFAFDELKTLKETARASLLPALYEHFVESVANNHKPPESFKGFEGEEQNPDALSSCECRKKRSNEALQPEVIELLTKHAIPFDTVEDKPTTFIINPKYKD